MHASMANSISFSSAIPVEIITGFPFEATNSIRGISVISNEAILYAGTFNVSKKSMEEVLQKSLKKYNKMYFLILYFLISF